MDRKRLTIALAACACAAAIVLPQARANVRTVTYLQGGGFSASPPPPSWEVVITEFMKDPAHVGDTQGEWVEIYNPMPWRLNIEGWTIGDDSGPQHTIANGGLGVYVRPGEYFVLGRNADLALNGGVDVDYVYTSFTLGNGADQIVLTRRNGFIADRVAYDDGVTWPDQSGQSISLDPVWLDATANDDGANWCHGTTAIGNGNQDTGTPGAANDPCP